nr:MAG TPA: hypothetical protein [Caudoviricetes sp.]
MTTTCLLLPMTGTFAYWLKNVVRLRLAYHMPAQRASSFRYWPNLPWICYAPICNITTAVIHHRQRFAENGELIHPYEESNPFEAYPVIKIAGRGYNKHLLCNDDSQYDVVGLSDVADRKALRQLYRKLYPRLMIGAQSSNILMLFIQPELAICLRDDSGTFQPGVAYHIAHCDDEDQWRYAYTEEVLDLLEA